MRARKWFITINKGASCFDEIDLIINNLSRCKFAYILHDCDNEEQLHYHIILNFDNARSFESVQNTFEGAHVDYIKYFNITCQYLIHKNDLDKFQYDSKNIVSNFEIANYLNADEYTHLNTTDLTLSILTNEITNLFDACYKYGINQVNIYKNLITDLIMTTKTMSDSERSSLIENFKVKEILN